MVATQVDHDAGSNLPLQSVRGRLWTSRYTVGATLALLAFLAGAKWEVSERSWSAAAGAPSHIAAAGVIPTGELQSTAFPNLSRALASSDHMRRRRTTRRHRWAASSASRTYARHPIGSSSPSVLTPGAQSVRLSSLLYRTILLAAQTALVSSWTTAIPPPANNVGTAH